MSNSCPSYVWCSNPHHWKVINCRVRVALPCHQDSQGYSNCELNSVQYSSAAKRLDGVT